MKYLDKSIRNELEKVVVQAREISETASRAAINQLGTGDPKPPIHLSKKERELRRKLRAHGRQLGDVRNDKGEQEIFRLVEEVGYEHWHRMLFARFLAENELLMYPDPDKPVPITLEECEDLAAQEDARDGWDLAARFATRILPQIFRSDSPVFQIELPPEYQQKLEQLVIDIPKEVFAAPDSLGWVYQFWQSKKKEEINASEVKIGARELPAVTQLFTEPYMVHFLLDNSLGAWWAAQKLTKDELKNSKSEGELRRKAALPGVPLKYLRFVREEDGSWIPASGTFDSWPKELSDFKVLDPCCGSGQFLVAAFLMLVPMRMEKEGLSTKEAVDAVLRENIHGLELDQRCVELAAFSLALTAWRYPNTGGYRAIPELNLACSGLSISAKKVDWLALAGDNTNLRLTLEKLFMLFKDAPLLGSLINPKMSISDSPLFRSKWKEVGLRLSKALANEKDDEKTEIGIVAHGLAKVASLLDQKYDLISTNFPFVGTRKQDALLREYCEKYYVRAKHDLATCLIDRSMMLLNRNGGLCFVSPHNWLFLGAYKEFRVELLKKKRWNIVTFLGRRSFQTPMYDFSIALTILTNTKVHEYAYMSGVAVESYQSPEEKSVALQSDKILVIKQNYQLKNPDQRITLTKSSDFPLLEEKSLCLTGAMNGDSHKFIRYIWEFELIPTKWVPLQSTVTSNVAYAGRQKLIFFDRENGHLREDPVIRRERLHNSDERGKSIWGKQGIMVHRMGSLPVTLYNGDVYDQNGAAIVPNNDEHITAFWCFLSSHIFNEEVRRLDNKVGVTPATLAKVPFNLEYWTKVAEERYPNGLPKPFSNDPTQWIFHGHPCGSVIWDEEKKWTVHGLLRTDSTVLQVAVARLLGYRWPAELDPDMELADEQREWVNRCEKLLKYADDDGIVCISPVRGETSAKERLLSLLAAAYDDSWSNDILAQLLRNSDHAGKTLETWLRDKFFTQHCKLFHQRPFIWHIWDGLHDGFSAFVNYHKLDKKLLETLIYTYLGDWISRQKQDKVKGIDGAEEKLVAAKNLKKRFELILEGESPYDIFVRWKPIEEQPLGWDPDLNDGVRLNIGPFLSVPDIRKKGAGVLRDKPNIKWGKDRGKDVESAPWYHLGPQYGGKKGDRINEHHLSLAEKRAARQRKKRGANNARN